MKTIQKFTVHTDKCHGEADVRVEALNAIAMFLKIPMSERVWGLQALRHHSQFYPAQMSVPDYVLLDYLELCLVQICTRYGCSVFRRQIPGTPLVEYTLEYDQAENPGVDFQKPLGIFQKLKSRATSWMSKARRAVA